MIETLRKDTVMAVTMMETETVTVAEVSPVVVPAAVLRELAAVTVAAGKDDSLPTLTGVRVEWEPGVIRMVATDRYRLAVCEWRGDSVADAVAGSALVPAKELAAYVKGLPKQRARGSSGMEPVTLTLERAEGYKFQTVHTVTFTCASDGVEQSRRVISLDGEFPKWEPLIPGVDRVAAIDGISCNPAYLADVAKMPTAKNGPVSVSFTGPDRPMVWAGEGSHVEWKYLLMPVRTGGGA
jgi:DNA polymerase III sliding clamp (beta) subunit (PCNA family)